MRHKLYSAVGSGDGKSVLGGVVEVVSSNPTVGHEIFFSLFRLSGFIISLHINLHYKSVSVSDPI